MSDPELTARARVLLARYLPEIAPPASIQWSMRMKCSKRRSTWGICVPSRRAIRISDRLKRMPAWVRDAVIVHELAHLKVPNHGPAFHALVNRYPQTAAHSVFLRQYMKTLEGDAVDAGITIRRTARSRTPVPRRSTRGRASAPSARFAVAVGSVVLFGRPRGERSRGRVVSIARGGRTAVIELLETRGRGRGGAKGTRWRVRLEPAYITLVRKRRR